MGRQMLPLGNTILAFYHPWEHFVIVFCCFIFLAKKRYSDISFKLDLGLWDIPKSSIFPAHTLQI